MNKLNTNQKKLIFIVILIIVAILIYIIIQQNNEFEENTVENELIPYSEENKVAENTTENNTNENQIIIHITGAVNKEGVYTLKENSRISDAIDLAGGLREDADTSKINLAYHLEDGMKINIPSINDKNENENLYITSEMGIENNDKANSDENEEVSNKKVNINTATKEELDTLPGIGESTAQKIINYRKENGKFSSIEEIKEVSGIGESKFENIKELICI